MKIESGIDIVEIARIEEALKNPRFLQKTLTETEREYVKKKTGRLGDSEVFPVATVAGIFAAKEAVSKAIGVGLLKGIGFFDIEIDGDFAGRIIIGLYEFFFKSFIFIVLLQRTKS